MAGAEGEVKNKKRQESHRAVTPPNFVTLRNLLFCLTTKGSFKIYLNYVIKDDCIWKSRGTPFRQACLIGCAFRVGSRWRAKTLEGYDDEGIGNPLTGCTGQFFVGVERVF